MFGRKRIKELREQLEEADLEIKAKENRISALTRLRDALASDNNNLRVQIADLRNEFNEALEAKETERRELCDQLGELKAANAKRQQKKQAHRRDRHGRFAKKSETHARETTLKNSKP